MKKVLAMVALTLGLVGGVPALDAVGGGAKPAAAHAGHFCGTRVGDVHYTGLYTREKILGYSSSWFSNWARVENQRWDVQRRVWYRTSTFNRSGCRLLG